jgi:hypothetical protein
MNLVAPASLLRRGKQDAGATNATSRSVEFERAVTRNRGIHNLNHSSQRSKDADY